MSRITDYRIVIAQNATDNEKRAAQLLRNCIRLVTGKLIPLITDDHRRVEKEIVVGKTRRERKGLLPPRSRGGLWEYLIKSEGKRVFICGLGLPDAPPDHFSSYKYVDEGDIGTAMGVYRFIEDVLGYEFIYDGYAELTENKELEMPENLHIAYTKNTLKVHTLPRFSGTGMYMLPITERLDWNIMSFVFRTKSGKLVVIDGGHTEETENLLNALAALTPEGQIPTVSAWLLTHLHGDHYEALVNIIRHYDQYRDRVRVEHFYCNLCEEEFYTKLSTEAAPFRAALRNTLLDCGEQLGCTVHTVQTGEVIAVDELSFKVIHVPDMTYATEMNMNDSSVVYKLTVDGEQTILFLGDAEKICNNDLLQNHREERKSDVVQVGHHGCGNVSKECYAAIGAKKYLWQAGNRFWYSDKGFGLGTHNTGVIATRNNICALGAKPTDIILDRHGPLAFELPMPLDD
ncbi:MAG: MBL fold metallo-hydrolase [Clostridia bacterium]|nr:MBL fold metallo-hydrolase [Clostridia bacterium]